MKQAIFNVFGLLSSYELITQMRRNFWHAKLLQEAYQLQKLVAKRTHRLTANTLPAPIVRAIASGDTRFVRLYENTTVLQADMVGFTVLSAMYEPADKAGAARPPAPPRRPAAAPPPPPPASPLPPAPREVLSILSDIFDDFDRLCDEHAVDKIKTIGDAYIVCCRRARQRR